jgi:biotin transport system permease protein
MTWGLYIAGGSCVHRQTATTKLIALFAFSALVFSLDTWPPLALLALVPLALFRLARTPWRPVWAQLKLPLAFVVIVGLAHGLTTTWSLAAVVVLRFASLLALATLVALTTKVSDMLAAFERGLAPLARFGVDAERVAFVLALTLRLIPVLAQHTAAIREAQRARGLDRSIVALTVPLLIRGLRAADALAEAIEARGGLSDGKGA